MLVVRRRLWPVSLAADLWPAVGDRRQPAGADVRAGPVTYWSAIWAGVGWLYQHRTDATRWTLRFASRTQRETDRLHQPQITATPATLRRLSTPRPTTPASYNRHKNRRSAYVTWRETFEQSMAPRTFSTLHSPKLMHWKSVRTCTPKLIGLQQIIFRCFKYRHTIFSKAVSGCVLKLL